MRIIHIITSLDIGGAQRLLSDLLPLQKKENEIKLIVFNGVYNEFQKIIENSGIRIIDLRVSHFRNPYIIKKLIPYLKECDIAHAHLFPTSYWVAIAARKCKNIKLVFTEHSTHNKRREKFYFRPVEQYIYRQYDKIISISQQTQDNLQTWLKTPRNDKRFVVVENGVNLQIFSGYLNLPPLKKQIIMVSRFAQMKDQETLIRAMSKVERSAELVLVGDGPKKKYCETIAQELGLIDRIKFLGTRSDVPQLVAHAYIGVQSSIWEGFGLTAVELMAARKPVIATEVEGLKQVVEGAGYLFKVGDVETLAAHINKLLKDEMLYRSIANKCFERSKQYDIQIMVEKYNLVYKSIMS